MRALRLTARFRRELAEHAPRGSAAWTAVRRAMLDLESDPVLPRLDDTVILLPYAIPSRAVPEAGLAIGYIPGFDEVNLITLVSLAPRP